MRVSGQEVFVPGGKSLIGWSERDNQIHEWNLFSGEEEQAWQAPLAFNSFTLSPDGRESVAFGWEGGVCAPQSH